jgi:galactosylxylosylprotein 3-beta-galactosyltransferase
MSRRDQPEEHHSSGHGHLVQSKDEKFLVILILSAKGYRDRRDAIRSSWIKTWGERHVKYYFALGALEEDDNELELLEKEQSEHHDLLIHKHVKDSYSGLTNKLLASIKYIVDRHKLAFLLKVDDDSFVQVNPLYDDLAQRKDISRLYWGYFSGSAPVKKSGPWAENGWFLCDRYLPYAVGGGYVLSADLLEYISNNSHYLETYISEDVSVGTWLSPLKINRVHDQRFDTWWKSRGCSNAFLVTHKQSPEDMVAKRKTLERTGKMCENEKFEKGHIYNWKVPPSKCCSTTLTPRS